MKKILTVSLLLLNLYASDIGDYNTTLYQSWESMKSSVKSVNTDKILQKSSDYIESINTQENSYKYIFSPPME